LPGVSNDRGPIKIVSTAPLPVDAIQRFFAGMPGADQVEVVAVEPRTAESAAAAMVDADIVIGDYSFEIPIPREAIEAMTRCRLIQQPSAGYQQIDIDAAAERKIPVCNAGGANDVAVAEHTVLSALAILKQLRWLDSEVRAGNWPQHTVLERGHYELAGKSWGIVGFGRIGRQVAKRLQGWDINVRYYDPFPCPPDIAVALGVKPEPLALDELLSTSDVISLHTPLTDATRHLVDADALARLKQTAVLINVSRGEVVDEAALFDALQSRRLLGAALDVFSVEPLPAGHAFTTLDNVVLTPHTAGTPIEARIRILQFTAANLRRFLEGEPLVDVVNGVL
jgi:glyoxylate reductase